MIDAAEPGGTDANDILDQTGPPSPYHRVHELTTHLLALTFLRVVPQRQRTMSATHSGQPMNPPKPFEMIVDRPFLFVIHYSDPDGGGSILFMGVVFDPAAFF